MFKTIEATLDPKGAIEFDENIHFDKPQRVLITLLDEHEQTHLGAKLSEEALSRDWLTNEEDQAWNHLQTEGLQMQRGCAENHDYFSKGSS
jgi:hypothetical protein